MENFGIDKVFSHMAVRALNVVKGLLLLISNSGGVVPNHDYRLIKIGWDVGQTPFAAGADGRSLVAARAGRKIVLVRSLEVWSDERNEAPWRPYRDRPECPS